MPSKQFTYSPPMAGGRGNSIQVTNSRSGGMAQTMPGRRRTTLTQTMATPFELRAIRLNTYLNVIINSASVSDFILLVKRAMESHTTRRIGSK